MERVSNLEINRENKLCIREEKMDCVFSLTMSFPLRRMKHIALGTVCLNFLSLLGNECAALYFTYLLDW